LQFVPTKEILHPMLTVCRFLGSPFDVSSRGLLCFAVVTATLSLAGCGSGGRVPIAGKVKFKDGSDVSVLAGYGVTFQKDKESSVGDIQPDGSFTMTTLSQNDGVLPGRHEIIVTPPPPPNPDQPPPKPSIPSKYFDFGTSGLSAEIAPGKGQVELELERAK
jgi:hypothetical protein